MTAILPHAKPKTLAPGQGEAQTLLEHLLVWKATIADTNGHYGIFEIIDSVGDSAPPHSHPWEETVYVLEGEIEIQVGDRRHIATVGAMCHIPANAVHAFKVVSPTARALHLISSATAEAFYREVGAKITSLPPDPTVFPEICAKYGVKLR